MRRFLTIAFAILAVCSTRAQRRLDPDRYIYPVVNVAGLCSANFGEMRPNHFHSGVDIKTDGVEGKPIAAVADGYIARIVSSPTGYGNALYIVHPEGTMSVYGHLSKFRADIDSLVVERRYRSKRNSLDIYLPEGQYPVSQGEIIALSGNTGNSFGPHLHFEIRDMRDNSTLNLIRQGIIPVRDTIPPRINAIHYVALDSAGIVPVTSAPRKTAVRRTGKGSYAADGIVKVAPLGYFIAEVTDRKNDVANRFGIYRITQKVDGQTTFEYRADSFRLEDSRYCNAVSFYPMQLDAHSEVIALVRQEGCPEKFYTALTGNGTVKADDGKRHRITIEVEDDCRNISTIEFDIEAGIDGPTVEPIPDSLVIDRRRDFTAQFEDIGLHIPAGSLYSSTRFSCRRRTTTPHSGTVAVISPVYEVMDERLPLHNAARLSIRAYVPAELRSHTAIALINSKGKLVYAGGVYGGGAITAHTRKLGVCCAVIDTTAPVIRPKFESGADMRRRSAAVFSVSDNFSGIKEYAAAIDGKWVPVNYSPIQGTLTIRFDHRNYTCDSEHTIAVTVTDNCGNTAVVQERFFR